MDKYPVLAGEDAAGEMTVYPESLYTVFELRCRARSGLWCGWAAGERDALRIGVLEPEGGELFIRRRFSDRMTQPLGRILRGELRPLGEERERWAALDAPQTCFHSPYLLRSLQGREGVLIARGESCTQIAIPRDDRAPFPLEAMFCFAHPRQLGQREYWVFAFNRREWPEF